MNKELIDRVWKILPAEFKEEVKKMRWSEHYTEEQIVMIRLLFGDHNLTSDSEGEEMLTISRKEVQEQYRMYKNMGMIKRIDTLMRLFGSKCLPDAEPKQAEPKFAKGSMVHCKSFGYGGDYKVLEYVGGSSKCYDCIDRNGYHFRFYESDLEPYTEPTCTDTPSTCTDDCPSQRASQDFDNIIKDSFSKERRLNIAVQLTCAMLPKYQDDGNGHGLSVLNEKDMINCAYRLAYALIAKAERGGLK